MTLWVFGYGSLLWHAGFEVARAEPATLHGYHRSFCMTSVHYRGTEDAPGLVLALDAQPGAACRGMALSAMDGQEEATLAYLRERELISYAYVEHNVELGLDSGETVTAVAYVIDRNHAQYAGDLGREEQARIIATAEGNNGPNADYLTNTTERLHALGLSDPDLDWLAARVRAIRG